MQFKKQQKTRKNELHSKLKIKQDTTKYSELEVGNYDLATSNTNIFLASKNKFRD